MGLVVYNTLSRRKEPLQPLQPGRIGMYVCGPTVYDDCHIGHLMGPVLFDAVARWLAARGLEVRFVNNITDIDDKIIRRSLDTGEPWQAITERYTAQYLSYLSDLRVQTVTDHPRCSDFMPQMIAFIADLIARDRAYVVAGDGVYYAVEAQPHYGKLSGRRLEDLIAGARIERSSDLRHPADFALWKAAKPGEPTWDSPWGAGRPGWHLECSVMSSSLLGGDFDIHGGGDDLKFPHHENEIAQSEACGHGYARCWMHNGLIQYGGVKISKSDPRNRDPAFAAQFKARQLIDTYSAPALRFFLLQGHYRRPFDFEPRNLEGARAGLSRLLRLLGDLVAEPRQASLAEILERPLDEACAKRRAAFCAAMDDDFNTGAAIGHLFALAQAARESVEARRLLCDLGRLLGLFQPGDDTREVDEAGDDKLSSVAAALRSQLHDRLVLLPDWLRVPSSLTPGDLVEQLGLTPLETVVDHAELAQMPRSDGRDLAEARLIDDCLRLRQLARAHRDFAYGDALRDALVAAGLTIKDGKGGSGWSL